MREEIKNGAKNFVESEPRETGRAITEAAVARKRGLRGKGIATAADSSRQFLGISDKTGSSNFVDWLQN